MTPAASSSPLKWLTQQINFSRNLSCISLCLTLALAGCQTRYETGVELLAEDKIYDAEREARYGLKENKNDPQMHLILAQALIKQALQDPASPDANKIKAAQPHALVAFEAKGQDKAFQAEAGRTLGKIYWELGQPQDAVMAWKSARQAEKTSVSDADYLHALRTALAQAVTFEHYKDALALRQELKDLAAQNPRILDPNAKDLHDGEVEQLQSAISDDAFKETKHMYAMSLSLSKRYEDALTIYEELIKQHPEDSTLHEQAGKLYLITGREEQAQQTFERYASLALAKDKDEQLSRYRQIANYADQQKARGLAIYFHERTLGLLDADSSDRLPILRRLIPLYLAISEQEKAVPLIDQYLQIKKTQQNGKLTANDYITMSTLAMQYAPDLSIELLERGHQELPPTLSITERIANHYAQNARNAEVERVWKRYIERKDNSRDALRDALRWSSARRNYNLAQEFALQLAQRNGSSQDWLALARLYAQLNLVDDLKKAIDQYISLAGNDRHVLRYAAIIYRDQRLYEEAEKLYLRAQKNKPDDYTLAQDLADLYIQWGKTIKLHEPFKVWLNKRGNTKDDLQMVGEFMRRRQRNDEALLYLEKAADKGDLDSLLQIAQLYRAQQRDLDMKRTLDLYVSRHSQRAVALRDVLSQYRSSSLHDETAKILEELITYERRNFEYHRLLAEIYLVQGRDNDLNLLIQNYLAGSSNQLRDLENITRNLGYRHGQAMMSIYQHMLAQPNPDPALYKLIGDNFVQLHRQQYSNAARLRGYPTITPTTNTPGIYLDKAKRFYTKYLEEASLNDQELQDFAQRLPKDDAFKDLALQAYEQLFAQAKKPNAKAHLDFSEVLFTHNEHQRAEEQLKLYIDKSSGPRNKTIVSTVAERLMQHKRYQSAEPYLKLLLNDPTSDYSRRAFERLAEIYRKTSRLNELPQLIEQFMGASRRPSEARQTILTVLTATGQWELVAQQLEQLAKTDRDERRFDAAKAYFQADKKDRAANIFNDWANEHPEREEAWLNIALFYELHGAHKEAKAAYESAVNAGQSKWRPFVGRGRFSLLQGRLKEGTRDLERAIEAAPTESREAIYKQWFTALKDIGQHQLAADIALRALPTAVEHKTEFVKHLAHMELSSNDPLRSERFLQEIKRAGFSLSEQLQILQNYGYHEAAIALLEEELAVGDYASASDALLTGNTVELFTRHGGIERLMLVVQPLLDRPRENAKLEEQLGEYLAREGHLERAAIYLEAAVAGGFDTNRFLLGQLYLSLGQWDQASRQFQAGLAATSTEQLPQRLDEIANNYLVLNQSERFQHILEQLVQDPRYINAALPAMVAGLVKQNNTLSATNITRRVLSDKSTPKEDLLYLLSSEGLGDADRLKLYLSCTLAIATAGQLDEALTLLNQTPLPLRDEAEVQHLALRLEAIQRRDTLPERVSTYMASLDQSANAYKQRVAAAKLLTSTNNLDLAKTISTQLFEHPEQDIAIEGFKLLAGIAFIQGQRDELSALVDRHLSQSANKEEALSVATTTLHRLGIDDAALELTRAQANAMPTSENTAHWLQAALYQGDDKATNAASKQLWRVDHQAVGSFPTLVTQQIRSATPQALRYFINPLRTIYPAHQALIDQEAMLLFRQGDVVKMRQARHDQLKATDYDAGAIEDVLRTMFDERQYTEIAKVIAPTLPPEKINAQSHFILSSAYNWVGDTQNAQKHSEQYINSGLDNIIAQANIARARIILGDYAQADAILEPLLAKHPNRPNLHALRAISLLSQGKTDNLEQHLSQSLKQGVGRQHLLQQLLVASLTGKRYKEAERFTLELLHAPMEQSTDRQGLLIRAMYYWEAPEHAAQGVAFFERQLPHIVASASASERLLTISTLSSLYQNAKLYDRAFAIQAEQVKRHIIIDTPEAPVAMNNYAYVLSEEGQDIAQAATLIHMAMATESNGQEKGQRNRSSSFIDTLGWVYYRQGKLQAAQDEIERALRSAAPGERGSFRESSLHLAEILEARGKYEEASWLYAYSASLE